MNLELLPQLAESSEEEIAINTAILKSGNHIFRLRPKQRELADLVNIFNVSNRTITAVYGGAMGGGKTYLFIMLLVELALLYPGSKWTILRETLQRAKETCWNDLKKVGGWLSSKIGESPQAGYYVEFHNESIIELKGENLNQDKDLDAWKSYNTNGVFIEQGEEVTQKMYEMALMRVGRWRIKDMPPSVIFMSINPSNTWVKEYFYDRYLRGDLPPDTYYVPATIRDNPTLYDDESYMSKFERMDMKTKARYLDGDWAAFGADTPWAHAFKEHKHIGEFDVNITEPLYISFDFNHSPVTCTIWQHYEEKIRCIHEMGTNNGLVELCRMLRDTIGFEDGELIRQVFVTGDMSGWARSALVEGNRTAYDIIATELALSKYQVQAPKSNPNLMKSRELVNSILEKHSDFLIHKRCEKLIYDCKFVESDDKHQIVKDRAKEAGKADYLDSCRYYISSYHSNFIRL